MADPQITIVHMTLSPEQLREIVREELASADSRPKKLLFTTAEAASMLSVEESWLAAKARAGLVPFRMLGAYRHFSMQDIQAIIDNPPKAPARKNKPGPKGVDKGYSNGIDYSHDGKRTAKATKSAQHESK